MRRSTWQTGLGLLLAAALLPACSPSAAVIPAQSGTAKAETATVVIPAYAGTERAGTVTYCSPNGLSQKLDLHYPESGGPWPALVYVHGGSWVEGDKAEGAGWRHLNDKGILVASVNYRLAAYNVKFPAMIADVKCAVRFLRAHAAELNLDPARIAVAGASAGGHLAALLGTSGPSAGWDGGEWAGESSRVQAAVVLSAVTDFSRRLPDGLSNAIYFAFDDLPGASKAMAAASPVAWVTEDDPPFLILAGERDGVVPMEQSQALFDRLVAAGVEAELVIVKNGDHQLKGVGGKPTTPSDADISAKIDEFLMRFLVGVVDGGRA